MDSLAQDFSNQINFDEEKVDEDNNNEVKIDDQEEEEEEENGYGDEDDDEEDDFSFAFDGVNMAAEETRLVFPLFNTDLLLTDRPPVKHVYAATRDENLVETAAASSSGDDAVAGPCCEWSAAAKKSNSTGFSKLWRFRDLAHRSNSDGRDAFVFLNAAEKKIAAGGVKVNAGGVAGEINNVTAQQQQKKKKNNKNVTALAHERYLRSKAKDEDRRRSYLPYRPELVGFFTNVNGGLTRNVHPY